MSWPKSKDDRETLSRRRLLGGLALFGLVSPLLGACSEGGFRPLYGPSASGAHVQDRLAQIDYAPIPGRVGQRIRNDLIFASTGGGDPLPPQFKVEIAIKESVTSLLVKTTGEASSQVYNLEASFRVIDLKSKKQMFEGKSYARAAFERYESIYANIRAKEDAENRAARQMADELKVRLAAFMSRAA